MNYDPIGEMSRWPVQAEQPPLAWVPFALSFARRHLLLMLGCFLFMCSLGIAYLITTPPKYEATTTLLADPTSHNAFKATPGLSDGMSAEAANAMVDSQIQLLQSDTVLRRVVEKLDLTHNYIISTPEIGPFEKAGMILGYLVYKVTDGLSDTSAVHIPTESEVQGKLQWEETNAVYNLQNLVSVYRVGLSTVLNVTVRTPQPNLSARLANAIVDEYISYELGARTDMIGRSSQWMEDHLAQLRQQASDADSAVQQYRDEHRILNTDRGQLDQQTLGEIEMTLGQARQKASEIQARYDRLNGVLTQLNKQGLSSTAASLDGATTDALSNPVIVRLRQLYLDDSQKVAEWSVRYGPTHSAVQLLKADMAQLRRSMLSELGRILESYEGELKVAQNSVADLTAAYNQAMDKAAKSNNEQVKLHSLETSSVTYSTLYQSFLQRYTGASQDVTLPISNIQIVSRATPPIYKATPKGRVVMGLTAVMGVALGFVAAFIRETMNQGLHSAGQVRLSTRLDCIGMIPMITPRELSSLKKRRLASNIPVRERTLQSTSTVLAHVINAPLSEFSEAIRQFNVSVMRLLRRGNAKVVGCVSSEPGEGKSTIIANLAHLLARSGRRVVLLDWDLRKRSLTRTMAPGATLGLFDVVTGLALVGDVMFHDPVSGLDFVPAGALTGSIDDRHASEILEMPGVSKLISELKQSYDVVLVDLPALRSVADAAGVDHLIDAVFMVVEWGKTDKTMVLEGLERMSRGSARLLGVVLNKVDTKRLRQYSYGAPVSYEPQALAIEG